MAITFDDIALQQRGAVRNGQSAVVDGMLDRSPYVDDLRSALHVVIRLHLGDAANLLEYTCFRIIDVNLGSGRAISITLQVASCVPHEIPNLPVLRMG